MGQGIIVINPYLKPEESVHQASRLKQEFSSLGVSAHIVTDAFLRSQIECGKIKSALSGVQFAIYLDKDKYQSQILQDCGVRLFNSHKAVRVCDDKGLTYLALSNKDFNLPKTIFGALCYDADSKIDKAWARKIADELKFPLIVKESFGSMGKGVYLVGDITELERTMEKVKLKPHLFQQYLGFKKGVDVRVIVIGGKVVCAMERQNLADFRSNVAQGGYGKAIELKEDFKICAQNCAKTLGLDYCGVDLLYGDDDKPYVCEVNSNAFISGIERATGVNVAKAYAMYVLSCLKNNAL